MGDSTLSSTGRAGHLDEGTTQLVERLLRLAVKGLPRMYRNDTDEFCFTRAATDGPGSPLELRGTSIRYAAIVALGAYWLSPAQQVEVLSGRTADEFISLLVSRLSTVTNLGDIALVAWAAAQAEHPGLADALRRLRSRDQGDRAEYVVEAAWVVAALAIARTQADVEEHLATARARLLNSVHGSSPVFPHQTAPGLVRSYRSHQACFADQVYPIQALARLHHSGEDKVALAAATTTAEQICRLQGEAGQWWWHYDARTGAVIEGYPVYTVHQASMAPMALLDLTEAGGPDFGREIRLGLRWIEQPPELARGASASEPRSLRAVRGGKELGDDAEAMVLDDEGVTWRKVFRGDPKKIVRGLHTLTTRAIPGLRTPGVNLVYRPDAIDRECRPYEFGWLLFSWLGTLERRSAQ